MRFLVPFAFIGLAACGPAEAPAPDRSEAPAGDQAALPAISPPGASEFRAAWAEQCGPSAGEVGSALCKAGALGVDGFSCAFSLGEDEYRRYSADLARSETQWVLADPENACTMGQAG